LCRHFISYQPTTHLARWTLPSGLSRDIFFPQVVYNKDAQTTKELHSEDIDENQGGYSVFIVIVVVYSATCFFELVNLFYNEGLPAY